MYTHTCVCVLCVVCCVLCVVCVCVSMCLQTYVRDCTSHARSCGYAHARSHMAHHAFMYNPPALTHPGARPPLPSILLLPLPISPMRPHSSHSSHSFEPSSLFAGRGDSYTETSRWRRGRGGPGRGAYSEAHDPGSGAVDEESSLGDESYWGGGAAQERGGWRGRAHETLSSGVPRAHVRSYSTGGNVQRSSSGKEGWGEGGGGGGACRYGSVMCVLGSRSHAQLMHGLDCARSLAV